MPRRLEYVIESNFDGKKVSDYLRGKLGFSSRIIKLLKKEEDGIMLNSSHIRTVDTVSIGDVLEINIPENQSFATPGDVFAPVMYADDDLIVFSKPAFMPVHPTRNHQGDTLANAYASLLEKSGKAAVFRPINRLDRDTTGLVVCGLNQYATSKLGGKIDKRYYAVVCGEMKGNGVVDAPIARKDERLITRTVSSDGSRAVTHWEALQCNGEFTLIRLWLETGRTHQIRVHLSHIGHPLVGDTMYGTADSRIARQALHCAEVNFIHPVTCSNVKVLSDIPDDMKALI